MVTINKALDNLIDALAGSDVPVTGSKATRVDELASMIVDGSIVIGGGGGALKVTFTPNEDFTVWTCDKTVAEIGSAWSEGRYVYGVIDSDGMLIELTLYTIDELAARFKALDLADSLMTSYYFSLDDNGAVTPVFANYDLSSLVVE